MRSSNTIAAAASTPVLMGRPLAIYDFDVELPRPNGAHWVEQLKARHLIGKIGVTYDGTPRDTSDAAWIQEAKSHVLLIERQFKLHPDRAIFQSWNPYPTHVLPETAPDTLTHTHGRLLYNRGENK